MLQAYRISQVTFLRAPQLEEVSGVFHAFSTRRAEDAGFTLAAGPGTAPVIENRVRFLAAAGMAGWPVLRLKQVHSGIVHAINDASLPKESLQGDAAATGRRGVTLAVNTADCVPILVAGTDARAVAAIHAGWRGTALKIGAATIGRMVEAFGVDPGKLRAVIGPHIGVCCYEVGKEVLKAFGEPELFEQRAGWVRPHLNLAEANRRQLIGQGLLEENIGTSSLCTCCRGDLFFSYRRDGEKAGRMMSVIGIAP